MIDGPGMRYESRTVHTKTGLRYTSTLVIDDPRVERSELAAFSRFITSVAAADAEAIQLPAR